MQIVDLEVIFKRILKIISVTNQSLCEGRLKRLGRVMNERGITEVYDIVYNREMIVL